MKSRTLLAALLFVTAVPVAVRPALAQHAEMGGMSNVPKLPATPVPARIAGVINNGTTDRPAANVPVELVQPGGLAGQTAAVLKTVRSNAAGRFDFGPLRLNPNNLLTIRVKSRGFDYESPAYDARGILKQFMPKDAKAINPRALEMTIFESAESVPVTFTVHHVAITTQDRQLKVVERIVVDNPTNKTMVGGADGATIKLNLPEDAHEVKLDDQAAPGGKLIKKDDGYWVAKAITPAKYESRNAIIVEYHMDWQGGGIELSRKLAHPVKFFFMAREQKDKELTINAPLLGKDDVQPLEINGQMAERIVNSKGMPMGPVTFTAGTDMAMVVTRPTDPMKYGFVAFVALLCLTVPGAMLLLRRGGGQKMAEPVSSASVIGAHPSGPLQINDSTRAVIEQIAILDERWDAGDVSRNDYTRERTALKAEALRLAGDSSPTLP